jgi:putative Holliday junction resolvase
MESGLKRDFSIPAGPCIMALDGREETMKYLALDVGEKTIGLAVSDPLGLIPKPLGTLRRQSARTDVAELDRRVREHAAETLLVGYPVHVSGEAGIAARRAARLARQLKARTGLPVLGIDERYSTLEAEEFLRQPPGGARRRGPDDHAVAAALILRRFLEEGESVVLARW